MGDLAIKSFCVNSVKTISTQVETLCPVRLDFLTLRVTPTSPCNMPQGRAALLAWRENHTGAAAPAAAYQCHVHARTHEHRGRTWPSRCCVHEKRARRLQLAQCPGAAHRRSQEVLKARLAAVRVGRGKRPRGPQDAGRWCQRSAVREIAPARSLPCA